MQRTRQRVIALLTLLLLAGSLVPAHCMAKHSFADASLRKTIEFFDQIPCLTDEERTFGHQLLRGLDYPSQRIFRQMCLLPDIDFPSARTAWAKLIHLRLSYEQAICFEEWSRLPGTTMPLALQALPAIKTLNYEAGRAFRELLQLDGVTPLFATKTIKLLAGMHDANNRALQGFIALPDMNADQAMEGLIIVARLKQHQARAAAAFARVAGMNTATMLDGLALIQQLREDDAWNAHILFQQKQMTRTSAWNWLVKYFATPPAVQEAQFYRQNPVARKHLLQAFYEGGEELIWKINNLHAITDRFGFEISTARLSRFTTSQLEQRFIRFSPQVRFDFGRQFYRALAKANKREIIHVLRRATAAERVQTARDLTSANIYALLARGSELYDSSFRDILAPILKERITDNHNDNLLMFLRAIDPDNMLVANFIVSLAQKGKLTIFFPADGKEQERILDLVATSAFKNEDAILLFSATFMRLLEVLEPQARTFLIQKMSEEADRGSHAFSRLIGVIMQYYLEEYPELLGPADRRIITRLVVRHGTVDLSRYLQTPFLHWKADRQLASISVFHPDDDGRQSFLSNARTLITNGYTPGLCTKYTFRQLSREKQQQLQNLIRQSAHRSRKKGLMALFRAMRNEHFAVSFTKTVQGIEIRHASAVYSNEETQEQLLKRFILSGDEMFAQRGHSYWRSEQIIDPLLNLLKQQEITQEDLRARQRFLSLGSCGGVKAYTKLTRLFCGRVDILATIGTGLSLINDPYNRVFLEIVAANPSSISWKEVARQARFIFASGRGRDYLQPGSLTAILHKILHEERQKRAATNQNPAGGCPRAS